MAKSDDRDPAVNDRLTRLTEIAAAIDLVEAKRDSLYAERLDHFLWLNEQDGVTQSEVARAAGKTPMAVSFAIHKHKKKSGGA